MKLETEIDVSQETSGTAGQRRRKRQGRILLPDVVTEESETQLECGSASTLILEFWPPELEN